MVPGVSVLVCASSKAECNGHACAVRVDGAVRLAAMTAGSENPGFPGRDFETGIYGKLGVDAG